MNCYVRWELFRQWQVWHAKHTKALHLSFLQSTFFYVFCPQKVSWLQTPFWMKYIVLLTLRPSETNISYSSITATFHYLFVDDQSKFDWLLKRGRESIDGFLQVIKNRPSIYISSVRYYRLINQNYPVFFSLCFICVNFIRSVLNHQCSKLSFIMKTLVE